MIEDDIEETLFLMEPDFLSEKSYSIKQTNKPKLAFSDDGNMYNSALLQPLLQ